MNGWLRSVGLAKRSFGKLVLHNLYLHSIYFRRIWLSTSPHERLAQVDWR